MSPRVVTWRGPRRGRADGRRLWQRVGPLRPWRATSPANPGPHEIAVAGCGFRGVGGGRVRITGVELLTFGHLELHGGGAGTLQALGAMAIPDVIQDWH